MLELYSIHNRNVGASLIEINEGMSKLLDKQVDTENKNSGVHASPRKVCDENKERIRRKNDCRVKIFLLKGGLYKAVSEDWLVRFR